MNPVSEDLRSSIRWEVVLEPSLTGGLSGKGWFRRQLIWANQVALEPLGSIRQAVVSEQA